MENTAFYRPPRAACSCSFSVTHPLTQVVLTRTPSLTVGLLPRRLSRASCSCSCLLAFVLSKTGREATMTRLSFPTEFLIDSDLVAARST